MTRRIVWSKKMSKEERKAVRDFLKDYETDDLTIVFADRWKYTATNGKTYSINTLHGHRVFGLFLWGNGGNMDYAGVKYLWTPAIVVNMEAESGQKRWKRTFLHEMGHYLHWKEDPARFEKESGKEQEQRAREFAELKTLSL